MDETKKLAAKLNESVTFDAVIHNAGVYHASSNEILHVNVLAPYILTSVMHKPQRLIYLSSDMHLGGNFSSAEFKNGRISYSDSKLHVLMLCKAVARKFPGVHSNSVNPGWVPTKMGGKSAPDDLTKGYETQVWLSTSDEQAATRSGRYYYHKKESRYNDIADNITFQDELLELCVRITGVKGK